MMDTVYGTKKYFQSLSGNSDIYRTSTTRAMTNDYTYQNTLGRRSTIGPYTHMSKFPSYSTDVSSQYGYNQWGIWRDTRNLSPSTYSSKSRQSVKSFSIILTTAAFIVVLAVLSIAGLAFYFSTFKSNLQDPIMAFEGAFRITKGDLFTTGLKYNHTSIFKQKSDFYKRFVERSLLESGLQPVKTTITGFGDGPLIHVHFRTFLDIQKIPKTIHSMEEHIRDSFVQEINHPTSLYRSLNIDSDSIDVKRILDQEVLRSTNFSRDSTPPASQTHFEERLTKKSGNVEKTAPKVSATARPKSTTKDDEPEVDVENAPVIQGSFEGSFEITKTDADITQRRTSPSKSVSTKSVTPPTKTLKVQKTTTEGVKTTQKIFDTTMTFTKETTTTKKPTTTTTTTAATTPIITSEKPESTTKEVAVSPSTESIRRMDVQTEEVDLLPEARNPSSQESNPFGITPLLDTEPWRPIPAPNKNSRHPDHVFFPTPTSTRIPSGGFNVFSEREMEAIEAGLLPRNKLQFSDRITENPNDMIFYHSFTNPVFMPGTAGIEKLGNSEVKPHPLPVPLLDDVVIPEFRPLQISIIPPESSQTSIENEHEAVVEKITDETLTKSEVSVLETNKTEIPSESTQNIDLSIELTTTPLPFEQTSSVKTTSEQELSTEFSKIGELLHDLLEISQDSNGAGHILNTDSKSPAETQVESRIGEDLVVESKQEPELIERPNFLNIREHVLNRNKTQETTTSGSKTTKGSSRKPSRKPQPSRTKKPTTKPPSEIPTTTKSPPATIDLTLFPSQTKWQYVNTSNAKPNLPSSTKRVFNDTLKAWIVESIEKPESSSEMKAVKNHTDNIQDISLIFDTLASKLGIAPSVGTKTPPFGMFSQNKLRPPQGMRNDASTKLNATTVKPKTTTTTPKTSSTTSEIPELLPLENISQDAIIGEAEVEVVDPTKYDEMLSSQGTSSGTSTSVPLPLVTLLPVRSNSGIRTFRPPVISAESRKFGNVPKFREAVVKAGMQVTA